MTPVKMTVLGVKDIEHNMIKTEVKEELELSECTEEMETCVEQLKCEESEYKQDMLDIESQGLKDYEEMKYEVLEESIDIKEHKLIYQQDGQHEESEGVECVKLKGGVSAEKYNQSQPENIEDRFTLASGGKENQGKPRTRSVAEESSSKMIGTDMLRSIETNEINSQVIPNISAYTAIYKGHNDCTDTNIDVDYSNGTHTETSISNDGDDKCLTIKYIDHDVKNKSGRERLRQREQQLSRTGVDKQTETDRREIRHECKICQLQFNCAGDLKRHLITHTGERPFECEICQFRFKDKWHLKSHSRIHTGEKPFECEICQVKFNKKGSLKIHLRTHTGEKPFECVICQIRYKHKSHLKTHLRTHTGEKPYECKICNFRVSDKCNLNRHSRIHTGEKPFKCEICRVRFNKKDNLKTHLRTHTGEKPFECEICKVRFNQKSTLKSHLRTHTDEKPFECEICKVRFKHKRSLTSHLRTHTGQRPLECELCKVRFKRKSSLNRHVSTHTGG